MPIGIPDDRQPDGGWRYSMDQTTWTQLPNTLQSSTTLSERAKLTPYFLQQRLPTQDGQGNCVETLAFSLA